MMEFLKGALLSLVVNTLAVVGWAYMGPLWPSLGNVLLALLLLGIYGLENKWAFPTGYWAVQLVAIVLWVSGIGALLQLAG